MRRQRWVLVVVAVVALGAVGALVLWSPYGTAIRHRFASQAENTSQMQMADAPAAQGAPPAGSTPRGAVAIDTRRQQLIGVRTEAVTRGALNGEIQAVATVRYDETRQTEVSTRVSGWIRELFADYTGKPVKKGEPLFTLYSPELLTAQNEFLLAHRGHAQAGRSEIDSVRTYSERLVQAARARLTVWDIAAGDIDELERSGQASGVVTMRSPADGVLVEKAALAGMRVEAGQMLFRIADLARVWVEAEVYERDLANVRLGATATVRLDAYPDESLRGRATYIYPALNEATRTARVRFELQNSRGRLRPGMFATVTLAGASVDTLTVPANAIVDSGREQIVFVAEGGGFFTPTPVKTGRRAGDRVEVVEGLEEGEQVAASATFFLDSESQLRGGLQNYERSAPPATAAGASRIDISFRSLADPPRTGENAFEVALKDPAGMPITDAAVSVRLFMPAMPTMNMPAMENDATLPHVGGGVYRGLGQVMMGGRWDVTVTARKGTQQLGQRQFAIVAK